ncbi:thioesterase family protein [Iodobacter sp. CM08]|uniref:acyl-CoA thioesterase n=1 Tax=Iodobacter sp. CM08 TaxID=3085902 RepID=UPI00298234EF|nr:thioesterase family protein [Iodobacter sp. CM08]MDW5417531.1 thioesterase family protein [Iodobacter sp. CM08]
MAQTTEIKVRGYHLDLYGHVNNARYLEFLEEARWALVDESGGLEWFTNERLALVISRVDIRYKRPATMGDVLKIETRLTHLGEKEGIINQRILRLDNDKLVAEADVTFAVISAKTPGALPLDGELAERLQGMMHV